MSDPKVNPADESHIRTLFQAVDNAVLEPSPYLKTRVLAEVRSSRKENKRLRIWQTLFGGSFLALVFVGLYTLKLSNQINKDGIANQAYVIHVEFNNDDLTRVAGAEVILPEDVHFVSKRAQIQAQRSMKLPIDIKAAGRGKLPFVVASDSQGEKKILVRLLDENNLVVREQVLKFRFAKKESGITF